MIVCFSCRLWLVGGGTPREGATAGSPLTKDLLGQVVAVNSGGQYLLDLSLLLSLSARPTLNGFVGSKRID